MKFYKILNENECHYGMQYQVGLNVDILPFNPQGDCEPGGIYFSKEDILHFLDYGPWIREVTFPEDMQIYMNPGFPRKWKADRIILGERREITDEVVLELFNQGATTGAWLLEKLGSIGYIKSVEFLLNLGIRSDYALTCVAAVGNTACLKLLLDVGIKSEYALRNAAEAGHAECVKMLLDAGFRDLFSLRNAAQFGKVDCVKLLLDAGLRDAWALAYAAQNGHIECVKLLLDADIRCIAALRFATESAHIECIKLLLNAGIRDEFSIELAKENGCIKLFENLQ